MTYIEGPTNEPWEIEKTDFALCYVQRRGFTQRSTEPNYERHYTVDDFEQAIHLAARLNDLDRTRAEREALMEGLGLDPSDDCRDEYTLDTLRAAGYGERMKSERLEGDLDRTRAALERLCAAVTAEGSVMGEYTGGPISEALQTALTAAQEVLRA